MTNLDAKVSALINETPGADSVSDEQPGVLPPAGDASGTESAPGATDDAKASSPDAPASSPGATMAEVFAEKLARLREKRQADTSLREAQEAREQAKADREAAAAEKARWEDLKSGSFLDGIKAMGRDPRAAFEEMQKEAVEAGTPEAQIKRMQSEFQRQLAEHVEPLKKTIEELRTERETLTKEASERAFASDFTASLEDPMYEEMRISNSDDAIRKHAVCFRDDPALFHSYARELKYDLPPPQEGFTMKHILGVLKSAHDQHTAETEKRRAARIAAKPSTAAQQAATVTVNGTAERRNAGVTNIGNDLATARAVDGKFIPKGSSAAQRIRERARRYSGG